ncbi:Tho complex subunit 7-domain-containing protein [Dissophora ornata]|nr:THO complex subunit 7 [Dissophora ornata]KAI8601054.1 Tho complex subunit 7-domain-containing protein [Dissophora ornata]
MDRDEQIIRARLSINERPLRRLISRFYKWSTSLSTATPEEIEDGLQTFLLEVSQFQVGLSRSKLIAEMAEREHHHYDKEQHIIEENIKVSEEELKVLAVRLEEAKQERANKIQYDIIAAEVSKFPSRESNQQSIADLKAEILELEKEAVQQSEAMDKRKKQFFTALMCLQSIQESIEEDQREEAKRLFHKRASHDDDGSGDEDEEEGFVESMEGVAPTASTPTLSVFVNGAERNSPQDGLLAASIKSAGSASPALSASQTPGGANGGVAEEDRSMFAANLPHSQSAGSLGATPVGTPGRAHHHPSPTPSSRSLTGTPNPDSNMNVDMFL